MTMELDLIDGGDPVRHQAAIWFARLRADDVSEADRRRWRHWVETDPRHRAAYERLERLWSSLGAHAPREEIAARLDATRPGPPHPGREAGKQPGWLGIFAVAATIVLTVLGSWKLGVEGSTELEYATEVGEHRRLTLEDGTLVTLDTDTQLRVAYSEDARTLTLDRGRAFFEVASEERPLSVHTVHGGVRAVGTEFEVYRHEHDMEVTLVEGEVVLSPADADDAEVAMRAGHRAHLGQATAAPRIEALQSTYVPPWLSGRLVFEDAPLADVAAEFNRYSQQQIVLADSRLSNVHITGVFRNDNMHAFIDALRDTYPVAVDTSQSGVVRLRQAPASVSKG